MNDSLIHHILQIWYLIIKYVIFDINFTCAKTFFLQTVFSCFKTWKYVLNFTKRIFPSKQCWSLRRNNFNCRIADIHPPWCSSNLLFADQVQSSDFLVIYENFSQIISNRDEIVHLIVLAIVMNVLKRSLYLQKLLRKHRYCNKGDCPNVNTT